MDKQDKISIRMNGEEILIPREEHDAFKEVETSKEEQAAAVDIYEYEFKEPKKVIEPEVWKKHPYFKKKRKKNLSQPVKKVLLSVLAALLAGLVLGFILLRMFVGITENDKAEGYNYLQESAASGQTDNSAGSGAAELPELSAFVIQAGYFTSKEKAVSWGGQYENAGYPTFIWEREGEFYLFAGLASSESSANEKADQLKEDGLQTYVKPWAVSGMKEVDIKGAEVLDKLPGLFTSSITGETDQAAWEQLQASLPDGKAFTMLEQSINSYLGAEGTAEKEEMLFAIWKTYENILQK
ncbi:SPOR domain-containing protein [Thalassobacillus pellis]|uniref:SPOR domain-containing protein n=1 Tax=Thalassobacillus pellis TaxID=748008 RepID=UPI00196064AE|nr:SPOR domain-containing protein [Thalassobacillus pellis]MBM7554614.1 hypothetical protein [Thalassobacillus pellis]